MSGDGRPAAAELSAAIGALLANAQQWDERAKAFRELPDEVLETCRLELQALAGEAALLVERARKAAPDDYRLIGDASFALRQAQTAEVWADYVLHMRKPVTDLQELLGVPRDEDGAVD